MIIITKGRKISARRNLIAILYSWYKFLLFVLLRKVTIRLAYIHVKVDRYLLQLGNDAREGSLKRSFKIVRHSLFLKKRGAISVGRFPRFVRATWRAYFHADIATLYGIDIVTLISFQPVKRRLAREVMASLSAANPD